VQGIVGVEEVPAERRLPLGGRRRQRGVEAGYAAYA
jgi:hypothetical protein